MLRVSCNFVADGTKTGSKAEDLLEVEPLVCRVRVMVLRACLGVSTRCLSGVLRRKLSFTQFIFIGRSSQINQKGNQVMQF